MSNNTKHPYSVQYDLQNCADEPIHLIRTIQSHVCLLACDPDEFTVLYASKNTDEFLGIAYDKIVGSKLEDVFQPKLTDSLRIEVAKGRFPIFNPYRLEHPVDNKDLDYHVYAHINENLLILEVEHYSDDKRPQQLEQIERAMIKFQLTTELGDFYKQAVEEVQILSGYDRVMFYKFDDQYNGQIVAEAKPDRQERFEGLHFPASDIPEQARKLFLKNGIRVINDIAKKPVEIYPFLDDKKGRILDLTFAASRGVSPIHIEYLMNMGVNSTMSMAIVLDGKLYGLISCHHYSPMELDYNTRNACLFVARIISNHISHSLINSSRQDRYRADMVRNQLFNQLSVGTDVVSALTDQEVSLLDLNSATGAAIYYNGQISTLGKTPGIEDIVKLIEWIDRRNLPVYATNSLSDDYSEAAKFRDVAVGLLYCSMDDPNGGYHLLWFKEEISKTIYWGGDPDKNYTFDDDGKGRIHPRKSFEKFKQIMTGQAEPWQSIEIDLALEIRDDLNKDFISLRYNEIKKLNEKLKEAYHDLEGFSYSVSHDLRAPLRSVEGFARIMKEDFAELLKGEPMRLLDVILEGTDRMNALINDILDYSRLSRNQLIISQIDVNKIIQQIKSDLESGEREDRVFQWIIAESLPPLHGDPVLMNQLFSNLINNAYKYTRDRENPVIEIGGMKKGATSIYFIRDNGIGIDMKYADKIFEVFSRLVGDDEYEGTGVGLAIVKKVIHKHHGRIWVDGEPGVGTTFWFELPAHS